MGSAIANMIVKLGMDTSKFEEGSNSADNIMKKFGDTITKSFLKSQIAMKALSLVFDLVKKGVSAAVQGFTKLVDGAKTAYASYEQLSGGVETLFGAGGKSLEKYAESIGATAEEAAGKYDMLMEAQSRVFDNAHKAWYTAGLSANDYMNTVTGFAASLKQSTSNSIEAADVADMAIQDMADNANKMGSSMESIQTAYQGFAKQNYTMLDNLKLGYGGTKEEMERLLADAEKLTGTKYDINSLKDVYNAIHAIQGELGITGTTSNEAFSTLEGSSKALGAAWENVKVSIAGGGEDVESSFEQMGIALQAAALNLVPRLGQIFGGIGEAMFRVIPTIGDKLIQIIPSIVPKFVAGGIKLAIGLVTGIGQGMKVLWKLIDEIVKQLGEVLKGLGLKELGANIMKSILTGIKIGWNDILAWFYEAIGNLVSWLENWLTDKLGKIADLPVIKDLFKDLRSVQVDLGGSDLKGKAEDRKSQSSKLRSEQTQLLGEIKTDMLTFEEDLFDKCNDILDREDGISGQVKQAGKDIVDAVTPNEGTGSTETLYDQIKSDMQEWYTSYAQGNYDVELLKKMQSHLDTLQSRGIYVANYDILNSGVIDPATAEIMKTMPKVPDDLAKDGSVKGVTDAVDGFESDLNKTASEIENAATSLGENGAAGALETAATNMQSDSSLTIQFSAGDSKASQGEFESYMAKKMGMVIDVPIEEVFGAADAFTAVPQDIIDSYYDLSIAISGAAAAIVGYDMTGSGNGGDEGNSGLTGAFTTLKGLINKTYAESKRLGDYWASGFITSIDTMLQYVCMTSTDEEGNVDASGGNTLVTAMGVVFDLFGDILNTSTQLAEHWKGDFIATSKLMRTEAGYASGDLQTLAGDADATAQKFATLAANIQSVTAALAELEGKPNAGLADDAIEAAKALGAGAKKGGGLPGRAAGGPVRAGDSYIVGERGPEFFTPRRSGYIIPNEELGSGNRPEITVNVGNVYGESYLKDKVVEIMTGAIRKEMRLAA